MLGDEVVEVDEGVAETGVPSAGVEARHSELSTAALRSLYLVVQIQRKNWEKQKEEERGGELRRQRGEEGTG